MATMWYKNVNCVVVYVDPSATGTATGATPADAITDLPTPSAMAGGTVYLLRRGLATAATYTLGKSACAQNVVAVWGMPLPTDEQYAMVPAEAKTAWDADAATQPILATTAQSTTAPSFQGFGFSFHRVVLSFGFTAVFTPGNAAALSFSGNSVSLTYVKTMITGFDLATAPNLTGTKHMGAIRCTGRNVRFANCEIQAPGSTDAFGYVSLTGLYTDVAIYYSNRDGTFTLDNCVFRLAGFTYGNSVMYGCYVSARKITVNSCTFDLIDYRTGSGTSNQMMRCAMTLDPKILRMTNVTVTTRQLGTQTANPVTVGSGTTCQVSFPSVGVPVYPTIVITDSIDTATSPVDSTYPADWIIDTVSIDVSGYRVATSGLIVGPYGVGSGSTASCAFQVKIRNYTFNASQSTRPSDAVIGLGVASGPQVFVENCVVNYSNTMAYAYVVGGTPGTASVYLPGKATLRNCAGKGRMRLDSIRYADIPTFEFVATDIVSPLEVYGGIAYIGALTIPAGWSSSSMMIAANRGEIFINSINIAAIVNLLGTASESEEQGVTIANNATAGAWVAYHRWNQAKSSTIYRTGGASAALYVKTNTLSYSARYSGCWLSPRPFAAKAIAPGMVGNRKLTMYVASKGVAADVLFRSVVIEVFAANGASGNALFSSVLVGRLEVDTSTWNNDTGLSVYKIVMPIKVDRLEDLGVRVAFLPFASTTAYFYIDPKIEISA